MALATGVFVGNRDSWGKEDSAEEFVGIQLPLCHSSELRVSVLRSVNDGIKAWRRYTNRHCGTWESSYILEVTRAHMIEVSLSDRWHCLFVGPLISDWNVTSRFIGLMFIRRACAACIALVIAKPTPISTRRSVKKSKAWSYEDCDKNVSELCEKWPVNVLIDASKSLLKMTMPTVVLKYCFSTFSKAMRSCSVVWQMALYTVYML